MKVFELKTKLPSYKFTSDDYGLLTYNMVKDSSVGILVSTTNLSGINEK